jgi:hypothetical protein|tara:strand:+ start:91 stop:597 length:507 start_codon:yes stop_codon:yes gene_type:complete
MIKYSSKEIKGYNSSKIAKGEKNDCFVRALAAATEVDYDTSHEFVQKTFKRKPKKGTENHQIVKAMAGFQEEGMNIGNKSFKVNVLPKSRITNTYKLYGELIDRKKTVKSFIKDNPKGTFVVGVSKHAFTVKDGVLIDNVGEEFRPTRKVDMAYKIALSNQPIQLKLF